MFNKRICLTYNSNSYKLTVLKFRLSLRRLNLVNDTGHIYPAWLIKGWRQAPATWSERHLSPSVSSSTSSRKKISGKMKRIFNLQLLKKGGWKNRAKKKGRAMCFYFLQKRSLTSCADCLNDNVRQRSYLKSYVTAEGDDFAVGK